MSDKSRKQKSASQGAGFLLWKAGNAWQRVVRENLRASGLTHVQFLLLDAIIEMEASGIRPSQVALSRVAGTDVMMTSKVIRTLEKDKLVARKSNRTDGRAVVLQITTTGKRKALTARAAIRKADQDFFSRLVHKPARFYANLVVLAE